MKKNIYLIYPFILFFLFGSFSFANDFYEKKSVIENDDMTLIGYFYSSGHAIGKVKNHLDNSFIIFDNRKINLTSSGDFAIAFGRNEIGDKEISYFRNNKKINLPIFIAKRDYKIERIDGLPPSKVSSFSDEDLKKIRRDQALKKEKRSFYHQDKFFDTFTKPLSGRQTGVFGSQRILNGEEKNPHSGVDVAAGQGTIIKSPASGVIKLSDPDMYFEGGLILIDHGLGFESAFMHLSKLYVKEGDIIKQGQAIGEVGSTGRSTGPHMHWGLKWYEVPIDPEFFVKF